MTGLNTKVVAFALALLALPGLAWAQTGDEAEDKVVARVDGKEIHHSDIVKAAELLPPQYQAQFDQIYPVLVERMVDLELLRTAAGEAGIKDDEEFQSRLAQLETELLREIYLQRQLEERLTDEVLQQAYQDYLTANPPKTEVHARHILVEDEATAQEIIGELDGGADFAALAQERSTGPSSAQGGDLGYFTAEQMVPEFAEAAFAMETASYSAEPVQTQFGWHVIKVEDKRDTAQPAFEDVEESLREEQSRTIFAEMIVDLRKNSEVEILVETAAAEDPEAGDGEAATGEEPASGEDGSAEGGEAAQ